MFGVTDPATETAVWAFVKLMRAAHAVSTRLEAEVAAAGLTLTQFGALEALLHLGPLPHRELGRKVLTSAGNMTDVVDKLAARGLVARCRDQPDRRTVRVALTPAGRCLIEHLFPAHAGRIAAAMAGLDAADLVRLEALLRRLGMAAAHPPHPCEDACELAKAEAAHKIGA